MNKGGGQNLAIYFMSGPTGLKTYSKSIRNEQP